MIFSTSSRQTQLSTLSSSFSNTIDIIQVADDFEVPADKEWVIQNVWFFGAWVPATASLSVTNWTLGVNRVEFMHVVILCVTDL